MHSSKPSQLSACQTSDALSVRTVSTKVRLRARLCTVSLLSADLGAFALSAFVAFALCVASDTSPYQRAITNVTTLGAGWHGWGSMLVLASLLSYLGARGHYTSRVPSWTQLGDVVIATTVALACDIFLTVAVYDRPVATEGMLRWIAFCPCLLLLRAAARRVYASLGHVDFAHVDRRCPRGYGGSRGRAHVGSCAGLQAGGIGYARPRRVAFRRGTVGPAGPAGRRLCGDHRGN